MGFAQSAAAAFLSLVVLLQFFGGIPPFNSDTVVGKSLLFSLVVLVSASLQLRGSERVELPRVMPWVGLFLLALFLSALQAYSAATAFIALAVPTLGVVQMLVAMRLFRGWPNGREFFFSLLMAGGVVAACIGLYQYLDYLVFQDPVHPYVPHLVPPTWLSRASGIYGQPNLFALFLTLSLLAFCYRFLHRQDAIGLGGGIVSGLRYLPVLLIGTVFFAAQSRGGMISMGVCFSFLAGHYLRADRYPKGVKREFLYFVATLFVSYLLCRLLGDFAAGGDSVLLTGQDRQGSNEGRFIIWTVSLLTFVDHPWFGIGLDNFKLLHYLYEPAAHDLLGFVEFESMLYTHWSHNELLQVLCEGGVFAVLPFLALLLLFLRRFWTVAVRPDGRPSAIFLYSHLFLLPFIVQSMFGIPFRFAPLMMVFWTLAGLLLAQYPLRSVKLSSGGRRTFLLLLAVAVVMTGYFLVQEQRIGTFWHRAKGPAGLARNFAEFEKLSQNPYSRLEVMRRRMSPYANLAIRMESPFMAASLLPLAEQLLGLQETPEQWYVSALLYLKVGNEDEARRAINRAIDLKPMEQKYWNFLHHLNILKAARETGRPVESFLPDPDELEDGAGQMDLELPNAGISIKKYL